ncbi:hypothetical protein ACFX4I_22345 [Peribacillus sp. YIM B13472]|uniref:hypothetical protein n=1 Tax=Peribacillus sp. YIM B13472 TaxID=3366297 RepID=UPI00366D9CE0
MKEIFTVLFLMMVLTACGSNSTNKDFNSDNTNLETTKKDTNSEEKTEHNYQFTGESEHWEAVYSYKATEIWGRIGKQTTHSSKDNYVLTLKYKGSLEELSSMKNLEYSYETTISSGNKREAYPDPPSEKVFKTSGSSVNGAMVGKDEVIKVNVKWDGFEESFELHNKDK